MSYITEIGKRKLELVEEAVDWLSYPVRISIDKGGEIHIILSVEMGDSAHYSRPEDPDPVAKFISTLMPERTKLMSMTFKKPNVIDEVRVESRDDCLVIHNAKGAPYISICTLMKILEVDKTTASRIFGRIARRRVEQICLTRPRDKWALSQRE